MGINPGHVSRIEQGKVDVRLTMLVRLAEALKISLPAFASKIRRRLYPDAA